MADELFENIVAMVRKKTGHKGPITREMTIDGDLRTDGDDAAELMEEYFQKLHVDPTGFHPQRFFRPEGWEIVRLSKWLHKRKGIPYVEKTHDLTIRHLEEVARRGKWFDPESSVK